MKLPDIPHSWLIATLLVCLVVLRGFGIDSMITASLMALAGYLLGIKLEQIRNIAAVPSATCENVS